MRHPGHVPPDSRVVSAAQPLVLSGGSDRPAVLLLHGYTGYPGDLRYLASRLNEVGYTVAVPRYPGHGTNNRDFRASSWRDWWRRATDAYLDLASRSERIVVGGLSMGGLLATLVASHFPVEALMLYAPAFRFVNPLVPVSPLLRWLPPRPVRSPEQHDDPDRQYLADQYWNWIWPAQVADLYRLSRIARRELAAIDVPTLTIVSEADRSVPAAVAAFIDDRIATADHFVVRLSESAHVVTNDSERDTVADISLTWLSDTHRDPAPSNDETERR